MRNKKNKHLGIEIDPEIHHKLHCIAKRKGRSGNGRILHWIRRYIQAFETAHGEIPDPAVENTNGNERDG